MNREQAEQRVSEHASLVNEARQQMYDAISALREDGKSWQAIADLAPHWEGNRRKPHTWHSLEDRNVTSRPSDPAKVVSDYSGQGERLRAGLYDAITWLLADGTTWEQIAELSDDWNSREGARTWYKSETNRRDGLRFDGAERTRNYVST